MVKGISVRKANADVIQVGILNYALEGTAYHLGGHKDIIRPSTFGKGSNTSKRTFYVVNSNDEHVASFTCLNTNTIEAVADDRPTYRILTDLFKIATMHGQKCTIQKNFVEVCDFGVKKESKVSKLWKAIR